MDKKILTPHQQWTCISIGNLPRHFIRAELLFVGTLLKYTYASELCQTFCAMVSTLACQFKGPGQRSLRRSDSFVHNIK